MRFSVSTLITTGLIITAAACTRAGHDEPLQPVNDAPRTTEGRIVVTGDSTQEVKQQATALGLKVTGDQVVVVEGEVSKIQQIRVTAAATTPAAWDEPVGIERPRAVRRPGDYSDESPGEDLLQPANYLAKEEFGIPAWQTNHPTHDGRGVKVGVIDDGISPFQSGFRATTTGERKFIGFSNASTRLNISMTEATATPLTGFAATYSFPFVKAWTGSFDEGASAWSSTTNDLNTDSMLSVIPMAAFLGQDGVVRVCVDSNINAVVDQSECFGTFAATGEFGYWNTNRTLAIMAEFDSASATLKLSDGESAGDGHGEGVASVLAGHNIGGQFDGVAPGAQILDFDISAGVTDPKENLYTIATFLTALDWLGSRGAEVCNISYSLFFYSAASQSFMKKALDNLINRYGFIISFSAGNNGPGIGSFNRGLIYPDNALVAAAYVSKAMDERVHGVTGLPDEGRIIWYSSVGPSPDGGTTPTAASPLASLTHADPATGFYGFSGTSSASPALAGFTTVLISALKQEGLTIKPDLVVNAVRLSGRALPNVPYAQQGAGVPQIEAAVAAYRTLLANQGFVRVDVGVDGAGPDGIRRTGILARTSQLTGDQEFRVRLKGIPSSLSTPADNTELLVPVRIAYSHPWMVGPDRSFLSIGGSAISIRIDMNAVTAGQSRGAAHFGDVRLIDDRTGTLLKVVPVTVIDDVNVNEGLTFTRTMGPEEGTSVHFYVPGGIAGVKADVRLRGGDARYHIMRSYDPSGKIIGTYRGATVDSVWIPTPVEGWYQLGIGKYNGTAEPLVIEGRIAPVRVTVASPVMQVSGTETGTVKLFNATTEPVDARLLVKAAPVETRSTIVTASAAQFAVASWTVSEPGFYTIAADFADRADITYPYPSCYVLTRNASGALLEVLDFGGTFEVAAGAPVLGGTFEVSCKAFESPSSGSSALSLNWQMALNRYAVSPEVTLGESVVRILPGTTSQTFRWNDTQTLTGPAGYRVELTQPTIADHGAIPAGSASTLQ